MYMELGKKVVVGLFIIIFINYGGSLLMSFFGANDGTYSDYMTWLSFLIIMWMFLPIKNDFNFDTQNNLMYMYS